MDAVTATLLANITADVTRARLFALQQRSPDPELVHLLGTVLASLAGLERRFTEGKV